MLKRMDVVTGAAFADTCSRRLTSQFCDANSGLRAITECAGPAVVVHVGGDIDAANEAAWRRLLSRSAGVVIAPGPLVVNVSDLRFMGSCAYVVLGEEARRCASRGVSVRLVSAQPIVAQTVAVCRLTDLLPVYATVDSALSR
jgi:anti-anti-sigma factor